jgi:sterol desaturase/sphingolipid hydroxylase (fatty acid hydroxylase superfamily)
LVLTRDVFIDLGLVFWFVLLAVAEAVRSRRDKNRESTSDSRLFTNFSLTALVILCSGLAPIANVGSSIFGAETRIGLAHHVALPWLAILAATVLAQTFALYWVHRLMHESPLLWRIHRVHHADSSVDVSTSLRNHPMELLLTIPASALVILLMGAPVSVVAALQTVSVALAIWEHADIALPASLDRMLARVIVTPRLHRLHHSPDRRTHDSNFGNMIMLWDRLFGTINLSQKRGGVGLEHQPARPDRLVAQMFLPFRQ